MKYVDEFRNMDLAKKTSDKIYSLFNRDNRTYNFMEVCGTHTNTFFRFALGDLLPKNINLISGPGCPVCVTDDSYIDNAILLARIKGNIITTFGDMIKVPGSVSSLYFERAKGCDIRMVYSTLDALDIAKKNPSKNVIFLGVGFETTSPTIALAIIEAKKRKINNFSVYSGHKLIPPAMKQIIKDKNVSLDGFILPAHVSSVIGANAYSFLRQYNIASVISGFEPLDMLQGILMLGNRIKSKDFSVGNQYDRVVKNTGNQKARAILDKIFKVSDASWRGLGVIPKSGLSIRDKYKDKDAKKVFKIKERLARADTLCLCGGVLKGINKPTDCKLFKRVCSPENPKGPCMVSSEGTCSIYYKYGNKKAQNLKRK